MPYETNINMWSGPRNISTAVMYSFAQRKDTKVIDEPFYAHYLLQTGADHPGREEVIKSQNTDPEQIIRQHLSSEGSENVLLLKNMAHHMLEMDTVLDDLINKFKHIFLIRDPKEMLPSLQKAIPEPKLRDTAYKRQFELFTRVKNTDQIHAVIESSELLKNPREKLHRLCLKMDIPFDENMLSWKKGPIPEDGVWAKHWYHNVHQSTGFLPYRPKKDDIPDQLQPLYQECLSYYNRMLAHAI